MSLHAALDMILDRSPCARLHRALDRVRSRHSGRRATLEVLARYIR
jgi:hypothetical protein